MDNSNALARLAASMTTQNSKKSNVEQFLRGTEEVMLLLDTSGSMAGPINPAEPKTRIEGLREAVVEVKQSGSCPMIAFGGPYGQEVRFVDDVPNPSGGTPMSQAIDLAKTYGATRIVIISDGMPDHKPTTLESARNFGGRIDVVFVGTVNDYEDGKSFLEQLAAMSGGKTSLADFKQLAGKVVGLLAGDVDEDARAPIQGAGFTAEETNPDVLDSDVEDGDDDDADEDDDDTDA
jgi:hypothetical protein